MIPIEDARTLIPDLQRLSAEQFDWIKTLIGAMPLPVDAFRNPSSDVFVDDRLMGLFFLYLVTHHTLSVQAFK